MEQELIPGLPEDIARHCLIRVPFRSFRASTRVRLQALSKNRVPVLHRTANSATLTRHYHPPRFQAAARLSPNRGPAVIHSASTPSYPRLTVRSVDCHVGSTHRRSRVSPTASRRFCQSRPVSSGCSGRRGWDPGDLGAPSGRCVYV
ncbi:uncharacterized protein A4U43_C01F20160 [Asparagus officinalis]|uniref:Uncharacterized protein n=1 Tax=Asparagus officinalis TaxID=4686 RepID=A0A5P1FT94_ASPOF|nr:uncharacterized protein A4U43_C01F20160 [Asparagus officinalis]